MQSRLLVALVPKPRAHLTRYHGVFAPAGRTDQPGTLTLVGFGLTGLLQRIAERIGLSASDSFDQQHNAEHS